MTSWEALHQALADNLTKLTREQIHQNWPAEQPRPSEVTLWRWLQKAGDQGLVRRDGQGNRYDPHYFWLPSLEERWEKDWKARLQQEQVETGRFMGRLRGGQE